MVRDRISAARAREVARKVHELTACGMQFYGGILPEFIDALYDYHIGPRTTDLAELARIGVPVPPPETLDDAGLRAALQRVIHGLASLNVFLASTDHLTDRALYERLVHQVLREPRGIVRDAGAWCVIDLLGPGQTGRPAVVQRDTTLPQPPASPPGLPSAHFGGGTNDG